MRIGRLYLIVFAGGFCSLGVELTAARLMAPFFGTSTLVWANIIGLTLLYLALGYWLGGRIADRYPSPRALGAVVLFTGATVAVMPFVTRPILSLANEAFATISAGVVIGSFAAVLLLFAIPVTALGAISPWAIRLAVQSVAEAGSVAGRLYAISTVGSLLGTFGSTLLLVPWIGARRTLLVMAVLLALSALPLLPRIAAVAPLAIALLLLVPERGIKAAPGERVVWEGETPYQFAQVVDEADGDRVLRLNEGWAVHSYAVGPSGLVGGYWDRPLCLPIAIDRPEDGRLAVLGNAGGTNAIQYARFWPSWTVDGVEIDPVVSDLGYRYFGMGEANITVHDADARPWLSANEGPFDAIVIDAYRQPYIPFHLVTREFFQLVLERLAPGGAVMINVGAPPGHTQTLDRIGGTMVDVFPAVELARVNDFNTVVIGYRDAATAAAAPQRLRATPEPLAPICRSLAADAEPAAAIPADEVLTDDHAPVEWLTDTALLEYLGEGAPGAE
jgi:spermidine synthase